MDKKVFIYVRRSSDISTEKQIEEIQKVCDDKWFIVEWIYKNIPSVFWSWTNEEYSNMFNELEKRNSSENKIDIVYVYTISRIAINREELNKIEDVILDNDIQILSIKESYQEGLKWKQSLIDDLTEIIYSKRIKPTQAKMEMDKNYRIWKISIRLPFWYKYSEDKKIIIDEEKAEIVKDIFSEYVNWKSYKQIVQYNNENIDTHKNNPELKVDIKKVQSILNNNFYWWEFKINYLNLKEDEKEYFKSEYPELKIDDNITTIDYSNCIEYEPIISKELFKEYRDRLISNRNKMKNKIKPISALILIKNLCELRDINYIEALIYYLFDEMEYEEKAYEVIKNTSNYDFNKTLYLIWKKNCYSKRIYESFGIDNLEKWFIEMIESENEGDYFYSPIDKENYTNIELFKTYSWAYEDMKTIIKLCHNLLDYEEVKEILDYLIVRQKELWSYS